MFIREVSGTLTSKPNRNNRFGSNNPKPEETRERVKKKQRNKSDSLYTFFITCLPQINLKTILLKSDLQVGVWFVKAVK